MEMKGNCCPNANICIYENKSALTPARFSSYFFTACLTKCDIKYVDETLEKKNMNYQKISSFIITFYCDVVDGAMVTQ